MAGNPRDGETGPGDAEELDTDLEGPDPDEDEETDGEDEAASGDEADEGDDVSGDDAEGEGESGQGQARHVAAPPPRQGRYQRLANENRELKSKLSTFERQLQEVVAARHQPTQAEIAAQQREEQERLALMTPDERVDYRMAQMQRSMDDKLTRTQAALIDQADKTDFQNLVAQRPNLRRFEPEVEDLKKQAPGLNRRALLAYAIGNKALERELSARRKAERDGAGQRQRQTARPSNGRGDIAADRRRSGGGLTDRLRGVQI
jgi:hypothetical protein